MSCQIRERLAVAGAVIVGACSLAMPAAAATLVVGAGAAPAECDYNSLQAAIDAAQANPGEDAIRLANDQPYTEAAYSIGQQDLTVTGGYADCATARPAGALPTGSTVLNGAGGAAAPVFRITGSGVRVLSNLQIRNGDHGACGGGIAFVGRGVLAVSSVGIAQNTAAAGGGICFEATASPAVLSIGSDVSINNNTATSGGGGGIWIGGPARLSMVSDRSLVAFNRAPNDDGGGVHVRWPAQGDIGSPGLGNLGVIYANEARRGGGVSITAADGSDGAGACLRFFTTVGDRPVRLHDNRASVAGGALYLSSNSTTLVGRARVEALAFDFRVDGNTAPSGPAFFLDGNTNAFGADGSGIDLNIAPIAISPCTDPPLVEVGRVPCAIAPLCNRIEGNRAQDLDGNPSNGNVIEIQDGSSLYARYVTMVGNSGARLISGSGAAGTFANVGRSALVGNVLTQEVYRGFNTDTLELRDVTIAGNALGGTHVLRFGADGPNDSSFVNVLIDQPGRLSMARPGLTRFSNAWVLATDITSLEPDPTVLALRGSGRFVDPTRGDFRLRIGHDAVDYAPRPSGPGFDVDNGDLDGRPRHVDLGVVSTNDRIRDLGPYERQRDDPWLLNGDFEVDLRLWDIPDPQFTTFDGTRTAPGSPGGSVFINVPAEQVGTAVRRTAVVQCFNVPSGGDYDIVGRALTFGSALTTTQPILQWRVRYASGDCSGPIDAQGDQVFGNGGGTWRSPLVPLTVSIDPARWTWNTTIEVRLDAQRNPGAVTATAIAARFDDLEIAKRTDAIFEDGFEP